jgi:hypothetical protein
LSTLSSHAAHDAIDHEPDSPQPLAALCAWLVPGLGHYVLGLKRRAYAIFAGVSLLFLSGLLIGGIDSVDSTLFYRRPFTNPSPPERVDGDMIWFLGTMFAGPAAFAADYYHQFHCKVVEDATTPGGTPIRIRRGARPHEIRDPRTGRPLTVRDPLTGAPLTFTDPATNTPRLSTPADRPPNVQSLGRVREIGTLFCALAGMMNLIAIVDAAHNRKRTTDPDAAPRTRTQGALA